MPSQGSVPREHQGGAHSPATSMLSPGRPVAFSYRRLGFHIRNAPRKGKYQRMVETCLHPGPRPGAATCGCPSLDGVCCWMPRGHSLLLLQSRASQPVHSWCFGLGHSLLWDRPVCAGYSGHPGSPSTRRYWCLLPSCHNQKCLQTWPSVLWSRTGTGSNLLVCIPAGSSLWPWALGSVGVSL